MKLNYGMNYVVLVVNNHIGLKIEKIFFI